MNAPIEPGDDAAGGFFEQGREQRVDQRRPRRGKQGQGKPQRKAHVLPIGFIHRGRMGGEE